MPNLKLHLEVAKNISKALKANMADNKDVESDAINNIYNEGNEALFIAGNLIPDVNNGFILDGVTEIKTHKETHFDDESIPNYLKFFKTYENEIKTNYLMLGYFSHIFTDYHFNMSFHALIKDKEEIKNLPKQERLALKQRDFKIYENKFIDNDMSKCTSYNELITDNAKLIKEIDVREEYIVKLEDKMMKKDKLEGEYGAYTEEQLDEIFNMVIEKLKNKVIEIITK